MVLKIDAYAHALPSELQDAAVRKARSSSKLPSQALETYVFPWWEMKTFHDVKTRFNMMDEVGVDMQIVSTPAPPLDTLFEKDVAQDLARLANDSMAELVDRHPDRLRGVATVPFFDVDWALAELDRAVNQLGLVGVLMYTSMEGQPPIDAAEFEGFYGGVEELGVPIWLHPYRPEPWRPEYRAESGSHYGLYLVLGWPYESSMAMARLVLSGVLKRHPRLKIITHHAGAMIPPFANRIDKYYQTARIIRNEELPADLETPIMEQFRMLYIDTVSHGSVSALMNSYEVFGADRMVFGTDMPFGPESGRDLTRIAVQSLEYAPIPTEQKEKIWSHNISRLCKLDV